MPVPFSLALLAMRATRGFHALPASERPRALKMVYLSRIVAYTTAAIVSLPTMDLTHLSPSRLEIWLCGVE